ncbi:MAG: sulfurtransferase TusA family protein [Thermodesulfovibrionales bacterium]|nr:sulfurtransferase TusA family protein [Thermodesulfovibrionales bacterium]
MADVKIDQSIDARGAACPGPLMELIKAVKSADVGTVIEILSSEKGTTVDAPAWIKKVGQELIAVEERGNHWAIIVKKIK